MSPLGAIASPCCGWRTHTSRPIHMKVKVQNGYRITRISVGMTESDRAGCFAASVEPRREAGRADCFRSSLLGFLPLWPVLLAYFHAMGLIHHAPTILRGIVGILSITGIYIATRFGNKS